MKLAFIFIFYSVCTLATELEVRYKIQSFIVSQDAKALSFKTHESKIKFEEAPCNKELLKKFALKLHDLSLPIESGRESLTDNIINYVLDNKRHTENADSAKGKFLLGLPEEFKQLKQEEAKLCAAND